MGKRFKFVIGVEDKQEDSTSFTYLTKKQMKAVAMVLNMGVEVFHDEKGNEIEEIELIQYGLLNQSEDDAFITESFLSELINVIKNSLNEIYKDEPNKDDAIEEQLNDCESIVTQIEELP